jgi:hypothetical protein
MKIIKGHKLQGNFMVMRTKAKYINGKIKNILATISTILVKIISNQLLNWNL